MKNIFLPADHSPSPGDWGATGWGGRGEILSEWHHRSLSTELGVTCSGHTHPVGGHRRARETGSDLSEAGWSWHAPVPGPVQRPGDRETHVPNQNQSGRAQEVPGGAPAVEVGGGKMPIPEGTAQGKLAGSQNPPAPGSQCPELCCVPPVSSTMPTHSAYLRVQCRGAGWGSGPRPKMQSLEEADLDHCLKGEHKVDRGSGENQDEAAVTGETGRCCFPGHHPQRNTGRSGRTSSSIHSRAGRCSRGLSKQAECLSWALRALKPRV